MPDLKSDCSQCFGLCCVLLPYSAAEGFGVDKPGGTPCLNLADDDRCRIHTTLRRDGWTGCTTFECFGAGQQVSQVTYGGVSWREPGNPPHRIAEMGAVLSVMRHLHELLVHLAEVQHRSPDPSAPALQDRIAALTEADPETLLTCDLDAIHDEASDLLSAASARLRAAYGAPDHARSDHAGRRLEGDCRGWSLRGALLIRTDLRSADVSYADLLGADLRDADVRGCDLSTTLFLTQPQVNAARGDATTRLPEALDRPSHWS